MSRKPAGVAPLGKGVVVICDDGSVWISFLNALAVLDWVEQEPVPGSERAEASKPCTVAPQRWDV